MKHFCLCQTQHSFGIWLYLVNDRVRCFVQQMATLYRLQAHFAEALIEHHHCLIHGYSAVEVFVIEHELSHVIQCRGLQTFTFVRE